MEYDSGKDMGFVYFNAIWRVSRYALILVHVVIYINLSLMDGLVKTLTKGHVFSNKGYSDIVYIVVSTASISTTINFHILSYSQKAVIYRSWWCLNVLLHRKGNEHQHITRNNIDTDNRDAYLQSLTNDSDENCFQAFETIVKGLWCKHRYRFTEFENVC